MKKVSPAYLILIAVATSACGFIPGIPPLDLWIALLIITCLFFALLGGVICGRAGGALIDGRNRMSLSRLQITLWTIVVVSAMIAAAFANIHLPSSVNGNPVDPMLLQLPQEIWLALGISATSLAATPLILSGKASNGQMASNTAQSAASFADLFMGDDVVNAGSIDLSKVQMFYFTLILVVGYAFAIGKMFVHGPVVSSIGDPSLQYYGFNVFPSLSAAAVTLLGISHAGYLGFKAVPQSASSNPQTPAASTPAAPPQPNSMPAANGQSSGAGPATVGPLVDTYSSVPEAPFEGDTNAT